MSLKENIIKRSEKLIKSKKGLEIIIAIVIIAVIIGIYISTLTPNENQSAPQEKAAAQDTEATLEQKLVNVLSTIEGAGKVEVMVTFESSAQIIPAMDTQEETVESKNAEGEHLSQSEYKNSKPATVQQSSGSDPLVLQEIMPEVRGAIIIAQGADDIRVKMDLLSAAQTVLKVNADKINVYKMDQNH
ncbi:MAG: hypothetical protein ACOYJC_05595 [Christensenellales bacterium]|jgi:stage III sporulation protein AG